MVEKLYNHDNYVTKQEFCISANACHLDDLDMDFL